MTQTPDCKRFAIQLADVWIATHANDPFPVKCDEIAQEFGIKVVSENFDDDFQACLVVEPGLNAIIYNSSIKEAGRVNFTIAHELGHFSLHKDRNELRCSIEDLNNFGDMAPHGQDIEREANIFAASLLMPGKDIMRRIHQKVLSRQLIEELHYIYQTSMTATACRAVEKHNHAAAVIMLDSSLEVVWSYKNSYFRNFYLRRGSRIDLSSNLTVQPENWGIQDSDILLHQAIIEMPNYGSILVVLSKQY